MKGLAVLGSTGTIGEATLDVAARHPDRFRVVALAAHSNHDALFAQVERHRPDYAALVDRGAAARLAQRVAAAGLPTRVLPGPDSLATVATLPEVDAVMAAERLIGRAPYEMPPNNKGYDIESKDGTGLLWFLVRREWRPLAIALGTTAAVALISFVLSPTAWLDWYAFLRGSTGSGELLYPRMAAACVIVVAGALTGRRWVVPIAVWLALPVVWIESWVILLAIIRLREPAPALAPLPTWRPAATSGSPG